MYESKEKSKEEPAPGKVASGDSKDDTQKASEGMVGCAAQESV
jgi:translation initiation factor 4E transporter